MIDELKIIKMALVEKVRSKIENLDSVNTHELGEAIDMIKDISEAMYYCAMTTKNLEDTAKK